MITILIVEDEEGKMQHRLEDFRERLLGFQKIMQEAQRMAEQAAEGVLVVCPPAELHGYKRDFV